MMYKGMMLKVCSYIHQTSPVLHKLCDVRYYGYQAYTKVGSIGIIGSIGQ